MKNQDLSSLAILRWSATVGAASLLGTAAWCFFVDKTISGFVLLACSAVWARMAWVEWCRHHRRKTKRRIRCT